MRSGAFDLGWAKCKTTRQRWEPVGEAVFVNPGGSAMGKGFQRACVDLPLLALLCLAVAPATAAAPVSFVPGTGPQQPALVLNPAESAHSRPAVPIQSDLTVGFQFGPAINPQGQPLQYIYIPGSNPTAAGGVCQETLGAGSNTFHNWDAVNFDACGPGTVEVTLNAVSLSPYTSESCGLSGHQLQGLLYSGGFQSVQTANACMNLLQDVMVDEVGTGAFGVGDSFTFTIPSAGSYSFASMNWCDVYGVSTNTGTANFTLTFNLQCPVPAPVMSHRGMAATIVSLLLLASFAIRRHVRSRALPVADC